MNYALHHASSEEVNRATFSDIIGMQSDLVVSTIKKNRDRLLAKQVKEERERRRRAFDNRLNTHLFCGRWQKWMSDVVDHHSPERVAELDERLAVGVGHYCQLRIWQVDERYGYVDGFFCVSRVHAENLEDHLGGGYYWQHPDFDDSEVQHGGSEGGIRVCRTPSRTSSKDYYLYKDEVWNG